MAYCGQKEPALRLLKAAVQQNYCAYSALLDDPLLKNLRKETAFNEVLTAAAVPGGAEGRAPNQPVSVTDFPQLPYQGSPTEIPQDRGAAGLRLMLRRLGTTARLMQTVAHPDDEDGGMLTLESRGHGASVLLMTLNRGEGGQNKVGSAPPGLEHPDARGVPGCGRSEAISRADCTGAPALAGEEALHR
jgi:hypothetical protein